MSKFDPRFPGWPVEFTPDDIIAFVEQHFDRYTSPVTNALLNRLIGMRDRLTPTKDLTIREIMEANLSRVEKWHSHESWSPLEWAGAMCGESGEAANWAKKLKRVEDGIANNDKRLREHAASQTDDMTLEELRDFYRKQIMKEFADTLIYGVLLCGSVDMTPADVEQCVREVFNQKSKEYGFPERI